MNERRDAFALVAILVWIAGALVARGHGIWIGIGAAAVALGAAGLVLDERELRARLRPTGARLALGAAAGAVMIAATYTLFPLVVRVVPSSAHEAHGLYAAFASISPPLAAALLFPIIVGEELVWRGIVQTAIARRTGATAAVPVAAALYALAHAPVGSPLLVVVAFGCGLVWSALRAYTGELVAPLTAHLVWDVCVLIVRPLG